MKKSIKLITAICVVLFAVTNLYAFDAELSKEIVQLQMEIVKMEAKTGDYAKMSEKKLNKLIEKSKKELEKKKAQADKESEKDKETLKKGFKKTGENLDKAGESIKKAGNDMGKAIKKVFD